MNLEHWILQKKKLIQLFSFVTSFVVYQNSIAILWHSFLQQSLPLQNDKKKIQRGWHLLQSIIIGI